MNTNIPEHVKNSLVKQLAEYVCETEYDCYVEYCEENDDKDNKDNHIYAIASEVLHIANVDEDNSDKIWHPMTTAPKDGTEFYVRGTFTMSYRWRPYKPASQQRKSGIEGRWQCLNEHGSWGNSSLTPDEWCAHGDCNISPRQRVVMDPYTIDKCIEALEAQKEIYKSPQYAYPNGCIHSVVTVNRHIEILKDLKNE